MIGLMRAIAVIVVFIGMVAVNALANILPINGITTGAVSDSFPVYFVPAGYVFSIWGVIYLLLGAYSIYQALPTQRENPIYDKIGLLFIIGSLANSIWIFAWHYGYFELTLLLMLVLLATLIATYKLVSDPNISYWFTRLPFSIYLGWITVATIANTTSVLYDLGWRGAGVDGQTWAALLIVVATIIALLFLFKKRDIAYTLVIVWAIAGILVKFQDTTALSQTAAVSLGLLIISTVIQGYRYYVSELHVLVSTQKPETR
jgi:hypothetical protein